MSFNFSLLFHAKSEMGPALYHIKAFDSDNIIIIYFYLIIIIQHYYLIYNNYL